MQLCDRFFISFSWSFDDQRCIALEARASKLSISAIHGSLSTQYVSKTREATCSVQNTATRPPQFLTDVVQVMSYFTWDFSSA